MSELSYVLARLGISQYLESFIEEGFETWETVLDITESDLDALNVKLGHRRKLQREIAHARSLATDYNTLSNRGTPTDDNRLLTIEEAREEQKGHGKHNVGTGGKRKYRRHPKPDENAPERPPSAYVIFSNEIRMTLKDEHLSFTEIAKRVGERWQALPPSEKEPFEAQAAAAKEKHVTEMARYKTTESYREHLRYLADFKTKNPVPQAERKRPRLETENSAASSSSATSLMDGPGSVQGSLSIDRNREGYFGSVRTPPVSGGHSWPANTTAGPTSQATVSRGSISTSGIANNSYTSPTSTLGRREQSFSPSLPLVTQRSLSIDEGSDWNADFSSSSRPLPRIVSVEGSDERFFSQDIHTAAPEAAPARDRPGPHAHVRRSKPATTPLLRNDTSLSSISSNLSSASTLSSAPYTPITPADDPRAQRYASGISWPAGTSSQRHGDIDQPPPPPQPIHPPLPTYSPSPYPSFSSSAAISGPAVSSGDIPQPRKSLRELFLTDSKPLSREAYHGPTGQPNGFEKIQQTKESTAAMMHPEDPSTLSYEQLSTTDPLSVLAYAGRMLDRETRKPP